MYVIEKMKLNKFEKRPIISNRQLVLALGNKPATIESKDTVESCINQPTIEGATKLKALGLAQEISKAAIAKRESDGESEDLKIKNARDY